MIETPRSLRQDGDWDVSVFKCSVCGIDFFTEDHCPFAGVPDPALGGERARLLDAARSRAAFHAVSPARH